MFPPFKGGLGGIDCNLFPPFKGGLGGIDCNLAFPKWYYNSCWVSLRSTQPTFCLEILLSHQGNQS
ncbi:UNVERIFIED_CONTAM: hypothetical protein BEN50_03820 [Euhalothece sp. KZN 001]